MDPVELFERAATEAASVARSVDPVQASLPTPCSEWDVAALLEHMAGGPAYLFAALDLESSGTGQWPDASVIESCVAALRAPGALDRRCMSPAGFEWSVMEATAGTAMDQMIHTWDLASAIGADYEMDPDAVDALVAMFVPMMPELGRQAGFIGPEVAVDPAASPADRMLGAMGRDPGR